MIVYILLYNANTEDEGIHTIQEGDRNKILMFQDKDDASRFAMMLEAQDFPEPTVEAINSEEVEAFCKQADYDWKIIESGQLAVPPEQNLEQTNWETEAEAEDSTGAVAESTETADSDSMSASELDKIRNQLEGLL